MSPSRPNSDPQMCAWAAVVYLLGVPVILLTLTVPAAADAMSSSNASEELKPLATAEAESAEATRQVPADERRIRRAKIDVTPRSTTKVGDTAPSSMEMVALWWPAAVVLMVIGLAAVVARRWFPQVRRNAGGGALKVLARQHLSGKHNLCLIRLGRGLVLVGVTPDRIQTISEIRDPEEAALIVAAIERSRSESFTSAFNRFLAGSKQEEREVDSRKLLERSRLSLTGPANLTGESIRKLAKRVQAMTGSLVASAEPM